MTLLRTLFLPWHGLLTGSRHERSLRWVLVVTYAIGIYVVSNMSGSTLGQPPVDDRIAHTIEYLIFGFLLLLAIAGHVGVPRVNHHALSVALALGYALTDEYHQSFVPGRDSSMKDVAFDVVGASLASVLVAAGTRRGER